jgi:Domain of unknown function (DUF3471)
MRQAIHPAVFLGGAVLLCAAWLWLEPWGPADTVPTGRAPRPVLAQRATIELDPAVLERYAGEYRGRAGFTVELTLKDGKLFAQSRDTVPFEMRATSATEFFLPGAGIDVTFRLAPDGAVKGFVAATDFGIIEVSRVR